MLADWMREWDRNRYRKSLQELRQARKERMQAEQALKEARQQADDAEQVLKEALQRKERAEQEWHQSQDWYHRQQAALQAGLPFDEPPPLLTPNNTAPENPNSR